MENRAGILYNDTRRPIERDVAQLGRFGYKMSRVPIPSSLPFSSGFSSGQ